MEPEPFVIGLTGNIASGKSVVMQCLANFGVLTIDADLIAQETYLPGNPAYEPILSRFGSDLAMNDGQINRSKLGRIVFRDPTALGELEAIIHPLVTRKILDIIDNSQRGVVAIEAIKLFEAGIDKHCDAIWAIAANDELRLQRLMEDRGLDEAAAMQRINAQSPQSDKISLADQVIYTDVNFTHTYNQTFKQFSALGLSAFEVTEGDVRLSHLDPNDFATASVFMEEKTEQTWEPEDLYRLVGQRTVVAFYHGGDLTQLMIFRIEQGMAVHLAHAPFRSELLPSKISFPLLKKYLSGLIDLLIVTKEFLSPEEAKLLGFTYGDDQPPVHPVLYNNFLRKHGLMPGEVYFTKIQG
jgi:dephospho-CoA kinase